MENRETRGRLVFNTEKMKEKAIIPSASITKLSSEDHIVREIAQLSESIKNKQRKIRRRKEDIERELKQNYNPILEELVELYKKTEPVCKEEKLENEYFIPNAISSPSVNLNASKVIDNPAIPQRLFSETYTPEETVFETSGPPEPDVSSILSTAEGLHSASRFVDEQFVHPLTRKFMLKVMKDIGGVKRTIDHVFGPRYENDTLMLGNQPLQFGDDGSIVIDSTKYRPSEGLYELVFKRIPDDKIYTDDDLNAYKNILLRTNAHKRNYNFHDHINRDRSLKYKYVINSLFPKQLYR